jgi:hypothetical protein
LHSLLAGIIINNESIEVNGASLCNGEGFRRRIYPRAINRKETT